MDKFERFERAAECLTKGEADACRRAIAATADMSGLQRKMVADCIMTLGNSIGLHRAKVRRDAQNDLRRRVLVGARVPRERAAIYRDAAERAGVSLYRWVANALEAAVNEQSGSEGEP